MDSEIAKQRLRESFFTDIAPIRELLTQDITDIMLVAPFGDCPLGRIYVSRGGPKHSTGIMVGFDQALDMCQRFAAEAAVRLNPECPQMDSFSPHGGFRVEASIPPSSLFPTFSLRLHKQSRRCLDDYVRDKAIHVSGQQTLARAARGDLSILVAGVMGSGKTTVMNALLREMADARRVLTIEDTRELWPPNDLTEQWFVDERRGRPFADAIERAMRSNADRIVVGEIRKPAAALTWIDAGLTGHPGIATIHALNAQAALRRLWLLCKRADPAIDRADIADIVGHVLYMRDRAPTLYEVKGLDGRTFALEQVRL